MIVLWHIMRPLQSWQLWEWAVALFVTSIPVVLATLSPAVVLPLIAIFVHPGGWNAPVVIAGYTAGALGFLTGLYGMAFTWMHEVAPALPKGGSSKPTE